jgi:hypothetical protein
MSLGIAFKGPEGVVLAADSRVTLMAQIQGNPPGQVLTIPATYDNATKLLQVKCQTHVGAITYGTGAIGKLNEFRTPNSLLPEFEDSLTNDRSIPKEKDGKMARLKVEEYCKRLSSFFLKQWNDRMPPAVPNIPVQDMCFLIGGYDVGEPYGKVFEFQIPSNPIPREDMVNQFGMMWGGQREYVDRLLRGYDERVPFIAQQALNLTDAQRDTLNTQLAISLGVPIPYQFLPLQDCIDLSMYAIQITIGIQHWFTGLRGVGGEIDVATITRMKGFEEIRMKKLNGGE